MTFKLWSDTNMMNACTALDDRGHTFTTDLIKNTIKIISGDTAAAEIIREEGGTEHQP